MVTDLDRSGPFSKRAGVTYLGPSLGAVNSQTNVLTITTTGLTSVDLNVTQIQVNAAGLVTIQLPSSLDRTVLPSSFVDATISITDVSGLAATNIITILPFAGELIAGAASALVSSNYGAVVLAPINMGGWTVLSYSTPADTGGGYVAKAGDTMTGQLVLPAGPGATNAVRKDYVDAADALRVAKTGDTMTGGLIINPPNNADGITINQTGSGAAASDSVYNEVIITDEIAQGGASNFTHGLRVIMNSDGAAVATGKIALSGRVDHFFSNANTNGDLIGLEGNCLASFPNGGTNTGAGADGTLYGSSLVGWAFSGATNYLVVSGCEANAIINTGGSAAHRWGFSIVGLGDVRGAQTDAALEIASAQATGSFTFGILLDSVHGQAPVPANGTIIGSDANPVTTANGFDFPNWTFTGNFLASNNFSVSGAGAITATALILPAWTATAALTITSTGGNFTTASAAGRIKTIGKTAIITVYVSITTVGGSASGSIIVTLPNTSGAGPGGGLGYAFAGQRANDGVGLAASINASVATLSISKYDGTTAIMAAGQYVITGTYEIA